MSKSIVKYGVFVLLATLLAGCSMNNRYYYYGSHYCWRGESGRVYCEHNYRYCDGYRYYYNDRHEVVCVRK